MNFNKMFTKNFLSVMRQWKYAIIFLFIAIPLSAQNASDTNVSGVITDKATGEPLVGVTVSVKGTSQGAISDVDGKFSIAGARGKTLVFTYIGYNKQEVQANKAQINISLEVDSKMLDDVIIVPIGYGSARKRDLTGATSTVTAEDIGKSVSTSFAQALQGRAAGVQVTQNSGAPGGGISISIRGQNTIKGGNEPLYVIDGVMMDGNTNSENDTKYGNSNNVLSTINPGDIVSMEVLKDASATAIYGTRAANGVILITTKQGQTGKTKVSYEGYFGIQQLPKKIPVLNLREYAEYQNLRAQVIGFGAREEFADPSILGDGTNWQDEIFRSALMHNHQISLLGGTEATKFAISGGYLNQEGIALGSNFERYSLRMNVDNNITKWLKIGVNAYAARTKQINTVDNGGIISTAVQQLPEVPARNPDGTFGAQQENMYGTYFSNPLAEALLRENYNRATQLNINAFADISFTKDLILRVEGNGSYNYSTAYYFRPSYNFGNFNQQNEGSRSAGNGSGTTFRTYLTYSKKFYDRHNFSIMAGHEAQEGGWENLSGYRSQYLFNNIHELDAGGPQTVKNGSQRGSSAIESYFGRANYNFDDRYLLTATLRRDGSSKFGANNRWATFPSLAVAWRVKNESFLKDVEKIDNLKLRLGWGIVGNQSAGDYAYGTTMAASTTIWGPGFYPSNFENPDLKWERTKAYNIGLDVTLFRNRIELTVDAYHKNIDNLLMQAPIPAYASGFIGAPWVNVGEMTNKGMEFTLNTMNIDSKDFSWKSGFTLSFNRNKVTKLYMPTTSIAGDWSSEAITLTKAGYPIGQFYGYKVIGMFKDESDFYKKDKSGNPILDDNGNKIPVALPVQGDTKISIDPNGAWVGDFIFSDENGDGKIDENDMVFLGNPEPKFVYGFDNSFSYKGFDLNIFLNGVYGNKLYNEFRRNFINPMQNSGLLKEVTGVARIELIDPNGPANVISNVRVANPDAKIQRITTSDSNSNNRMSDRWIEDGSYLRIKNISLGYTLPKSFVSKFQVENLRIYMNFQNLFTFTNYKGYDPEVGQWSVIMRGRDNARYPSQRIYTFGLNITL